MTNLVQRLHTLFIKSHKTIATAESCTSGLLAAALTESEGSSAYFVGGVNAYANAAKELLLGVPADVIEKNGAVSEKVAKAMAEGIRSKLQTDFAISLTGIAGPGGGTEQKPVGTVWMGVSDRDHTEAKLLHLSGDRSEVRAAAVEAAQHVMLERLENL